MLIGGMLLVGWIPFGALTFALVLLLVGAGLIV